MLKEIDTNTELKAGDKIEIHYKYTGWDNLFFKATIAAIAENAVKKHDNFSIDSVDYTNTEVIFHASVIVPANAPVHNQAGIVSTATVIAACSAVVGLVGWLLLDKIYMVVQTPAAKAVTYSIFIVVVLAAVLVLFNAKSFSGKLLSKI